jgi:crotonobetainyl-CoA:carnitine CoA-transferase CaiB-like acyl-CoA transferase
VTETAALAGIRIIDLSMGWAGPLATRHLADMGADIIKVESCERFDWWRSWEATEEWIANDGAEKSTAFNTVNRNKRNITLDLEQPQGRELLLKLVGTANAVVENFSGGVLPKLQLSYDVFREVNERVILLSMPAFGSTGPWQNFRAYGSTVEQSSGLPHLNGRADDPPAMQHVAFGDAVGGLNGASALLVALRHQAKTGLGQFVDLSQVEGLFPLAAHGILEYSANGREPVRGEANSATTGKLQGVFPCAASTQSEGDDNWIVIEARNENEWRALQIAAAPALDDFSNLSDACTRRTTFEARLRDWTITQPAFNLMSSLQAKGIPAAATHSAGTLINDAQLTARGFWQWLERPVVGNQPNPSPPYRSRETPIRLSTPAPTLGQHNAEVLGGILGLDEQELTDLEANGIIGQRPRLPGTGPGT